MSNTFESRVNAVISLSNFRSYSITSFTSNGIIFPIWLKVCLEDMISTEFHQEKLLVSYYFSGFQIIKCNVIHNYVLRAGHMNSFGGNNQVAYNEDFFMDLSPPPPPPPPLRRMNCGELRHHHDGTFVEMNGKVHRSRLGRFIELKDQYGITQIVAPMEVKWYHRNPFILTVIIVSLLINRTLEY